MSLFDALWLGLLQGLTEFIPVSSSGHLLLFDALRGGNVSFEFETLTNIGTLLAAVVYFRKDLIKLLRRDEGTITDYKTLFIAIAPVLFFGALVALFDLDFLQSTRFAVVMLIAVGVVMVFEPKLPQKVANSVNFKQGLIIGMLQVIALIPGASRSGVTIMAGRSQGLTRSLAARFSFILSIPVVGAAVALTVVSVMAEGQDLNIIALVIANIASFTSAILGIHFLLKLLERFSLAGFGFYRIALGIVLLLLL